MRRVLPVLACALPAPPVVNLFNLVLRSLSEELVEERRPFHSPRAVHITPFYPIFGKVYYGNAIINCASNWFNYAFLIAMALVL